MCAACFVSLCFFFRSQAAISVIARLVAPSDLIAAAGAQLRDEVAVAAASDDYGALDAAPHVGQLFVDMEAQLRALAQQAAAASGPAGCVSGLRLEDGSKAAALSELAKLCAVAQLRTKIACGQSAKVKPAASPVPAASAPTLQRLDSRVLPPAFKAILSCFFGGIPVGHRQATSARPQRARGRRAVVTSRCGSPSRPFAC
jgi:hypothetical protein